MVAQHISIHDAATRRMPLTTPTWKHVRDALSTIVAPAFAVAGVSLTAVAVSSAPTYPSKLIKLVVPLAAGGAPDVIARLRSEEHTSELQSRFGISYAAF